MGFSVTTDDLLTNGDNTLLVDYYYDYPSYDYPEVYPPYNDYNPDSYHNSGDGGSGGGTGGHNSVGDGAANGDYDDSADVNPSGIGINSTYPEVDDEHVVDYEELPPSRRPTNLIKSNSAHSNFGLIVILDPKIMQYGKSATNNYHGFKVFPQHYKFTTDFNIFLRSVAKESKWEMGCLDARYSLCGSILRQYPTDGAWVRFTWKSLGEEYYTALTNAICCTYRQLATVALSTIPFLVVPWFSSP